MHPPNRFLDLGFCKPMDLGTNIERGRQKRLVDEQSSEL